MLVMSAPKANAASKSIQLSWNKVSGAKGYEVYQYKNNKWTKIKTTTSTNPKTGLRKNKVYYFTVKAYRTVDGKTYNGGYVTKNIKDQMTSVKIKYG